MTNRKAPNNRLPSTIREEGGAWMDVIPEKPETLEDVATAGAKIFATYMKDVASRVSVYSLSGQMENEIALPGVGTTGGFGGNHDDKITFFSFTSLNYLARYSVMTSPREPRKCSIAGNFRFQGG